MIAQAGYDRQAPPDERSVSPTEERNPRTYDIDVVPTADVVRLLADEDEGIVAAVRAQHPRIVQAVELAVAGIRAGGRVHYVGSGTSGRMGMMDAAELLPTFGVGREMFVPHLAGGLDAFRVAVEGAEDDVAAGAAAVADTGPHDLVIGIAASGGTPYVRGALERGRLNGAPTVLVAANPWAALAHTVDVAILVDTGPEAITGSTRLKAGTAQKLVLNSFSTAVMIRLGKTYSNLMVEFLATNAKLRDRQTRLLVQATGLDTETCEKILVEADGRLPLALVMLLGGVDAPTADAALRGADGVRAALARLGGSAG